MPAREAAADVVRVRERMRVERLFGGQVERASIAVRVPVHVIMSVVMAVSVVVIMVGGVIVRMTVVVTVIVIVRVIVVLVIVTMRVLARAVLLAPRAPSIQSAMPMIRAAEATAGTARSFRVHAPPQVHAAERDHPNDQRVRQRRAESEQHGLHHGAAHRDDECGHHRLRVPRLEAVQRAEQDRGRKVEPRGRRACLEELRVSMGRSLLVRGTSRSL